MPRVAEEIAVLLLRDRGGWYCTGADAGDSLGGALLAELVFEGFLERAVDESDIWSRRRIRPQSVEPPSDPVLSQVWEAISQDRGATAVQRKVAKMARDLVMETLARAETVSRTPRLFLGPRYGLLETARRDALRTELKAIVLDGAEADDRQRSIIQLLQGANCLRQALGLPLKGSMAIGRGARALGKPAWPEKTAIDQMAGRRAAAAAAAS